MFPRILQLTLTFSLFFGLILTSSVQALPDLTNEPPQPVPINYEDLFFVYFRYGNPATVTTTPNLTTFLEIEGDGFFVDENELFDLYYNPENGQTIPQIPVCSNEFAGLDYQIDSSLFRDGNLTYGPQSADTLLKPSGQETSDISPRSAGCLRIGLRVNSEAKTGEQSTLRFNPDANNSAPDLSPGIQTLTLVVSEAVECAEDEEFVNGTCQQICTEGEARSVAGVCVTLNELCGPGRDFFEDRCVSSCQVNQLRDEGGNCVEETSETLVFLSRIWTVPLILAGVILLLIGLSFAIKKTIREAKKRLNRY